jgi:hypothetical protein
VPFDGGFVSYATLFRFRLRLFVFRSQRRRSAVRFRFGLAAGGFARDSAAQHYFHSHRRSSFRCDGFRGTSVSRDTPSGRARARRRAFENAFVTTALRSPSRATILTGVYAHRHGMVDNNNPVRAGLEFSRNVCNALATRRDFSASGTWAAKAMHRSLVSIAG